MYGTRGQKLIEAAEARRSAEEAGSFQLLNNDSSVILAFPQFCRSMHFFFQSYRHHLRRQCFSVSSLIKFNAGITCRVFFSVSGVPDCCQCTPWTTTPGLGIMNVGWSLGVVNLCETQKALTFRIVAAARNPSITFLKQGMTSEEKIPGRPFPSQTWTTKFQTLPHPIQPSSDGAEDRLEPRNC